MYVSIYVYRHTDAVAVLLVTVGLAQARPNYSTIALSHSNGVGCTPTIVLAHSATMHAGTLQDCCYSNPYVVLCKKLITFLIN